MNAALLAAQLPEGRIDDHAPDYTPPVRWGSTRSVILAESVVWTRTTAGHGFAEQVSWSWTYAVYGFREAA